MSIRPKQLARMGEFHLEEAILDVLLNMYPEETSIGNAELSRRAGIFRETGVSGMNDAIVVGMCNKLEAQGKLEKVPKGWKLSKAEYERRRDDIELNR